MRLSLSSVLLGLPTLSRTGKKQKARAKGVNLKVRERAKFAVRSRYPFGPCFLLFTVRNTYDFTHADTCIIPFFIVIFFNRFTPLIQPTLLHTIIIMSLARSGLHAPKLRSLHLPPLRLCRLAVFSINPPFPPHTWWQKIR